jgi:hypothetical protein
MNKLVNNMLRQFESFMVNQGRWMDLSCMEIFLIDRLPYSTLDV